MISGIHLHEDLKKAFLELGFSEMTDIQVKTIPLIQQGKDVIGQSKTGSGKTAAFGFPLLEKVSHGHGLQSLILVPTRELCEQVTNELRKFAKYKRMNITAVYGGVSINPQIHNLPRADVVVGTPGRILDHLQRRTINFGNVKVLVLDEADKMFEMGFIEDVKKIISQIPRERQTLLFSATISQQVHDIVNYYMRHPEKIKVQSYVEQSVMAQFFYSVPSRDKFSLLVHLLKHEKPELTIVFCATRKRVDIVGRNLQMNGINALSIHGGLSQNRRKEVMRMIHERKTSVLVASDVAARGLDIKEVSHIFNYDIPKTSKEYIHRIGRTARAGAEGKVISLLSEEDHENMRNVLQDRSIVVQKLQLPQFERVSFMPYMRRESFGHRPFGVQRHGRQRNSHSYQGRRRHGQEKEQHSERKPQSGRYQSHSSGERRNYSGRTHHKRFS